MGHGSRFFRRRLAMALAGAMAVAIRIMTQVTITAPAQWTSGQEKSPPFQVDTLVL